MAKAVNTGNVKLPGDGFEEHFHRELVLAAWLRVSELPIIFTDRVRGHSKLGIDQVIRGFTSFCTATLQYRLHLGRFNRPTDIGSKVGERFVDGIAGGK